MITGETGVGKTRLAEEMIGWAERQGIATATAHCFAAEGELSYAPITAWLRSRPLPTLEEVWLSEIARILPEVLVEHPQLTIPMPLTENWQRMRLFKSLARAVLKESSERILLIEDLQWCDRDTVEWLHFLLRFDLQARLLVLGTVRTEDVTPDHSLNALISAERQTEQLTELTLGPLSAAETAALADQPG